MTKARNLPAGVHATPAFDVISTNFSIPVPAASFLALITAENWDVDETLYRKLTRDTAAENVDYDGHFGDQIVLSLDFDDDTPENREQIVKVINDHLSYCITVCEEKASASLANHQPADPA